MNLTSPLFKQLSNNLKTYNSVTNSNKLSLCDPITQICKRIEAFFKGDIDVHCSFVVNNNKSLPPKTDDQGNVITKRIIIDGDHYDAVVEQDHLCEFRIFVDDYEKAQCLANVVRHRHTFNEQFLGSDDNLHLRSHILQVKVFTLNAVDPDGHGGGSDPWITEDDTDKGIQEIFGLEPIDWNDYQYSGCNDRLSPTDLTDVDIPRGAPDEYEQRQWEENPNACAWKWKWLKTALNGNKHIVDMSYEFSDGMNTWRFIECGRIPVTFSEDNLTSARGFNSVLPADLLPLVFAVFGKFQVATYARKAD